MKQFFFPVTAIVGCAGIAFIAGTQLSIQQTSVSATQPSETLNTEATSQQPKTDLEADCHQQETCGQTGIAAEGLTEFQTRLQRIVDRAENEITRLKDETTLQRVEMNPSNAALMNQEMQQDMSVPDQNIQRDLLRQVVSSSLQPSASVSLRPVDAVERNSVEEKNESSVMPDENSPSVELIDRSNAEIQSRQP